MYTNSYIFRNVQRLEMRGGICLDEEFIYPVLFKGTTSVDYQMATFVLGGGGGGTGLGGTDHAESSTSVVGTRHFSFESGHGWISYVNKDNTNSIK
jgi:hypothetical protein